MSKRITELPLATQLNNEDQFIFYSNSDKETQRINAGISLNVIANNLPSVLKATTNAALGIANAAVAQAAASAAQADATTAIGDAAGAQASADGKNKIFYQTTAPTNPISGYTLKENDLWFDIDGGYRMAKWDGTQWVDYGLESEAIANLDAGKITAGFISSQAIELANSDAFLQSSSYIQTWVSGMQCSVYNGSAANYGKLTPSHNVRCKVKQENGTYKVFNCLNVAGSTNAPAASGNNTWWAEIAVPTVAVDVGGETVNIPNFGFRVVGQGTAEFSAATFTGNIQTNTGFFGSGKNIVRIGSSGLTIGNSGYIKSDGVTYSEISPSVIDFSGNGFFLGNTQGEGQDDAYQFYIGNRITSKYLKWDGTNLIINGRIATGSTLGDSNSGSSVNSQGGIVVGSKIGIRRNVDTDVLTITGGTDNWINSGAGQIDLTGIGAQPPGSTLVLGVVQLIGGKSSTGKVFLRTWSGAGDGFYDCVTASTNGSVGINNTSPSSSYKLDVDGAGRFTGELISSNITASISTYTVGLWDGGNNIRFKYEDGLYAKIDNTEPVLIVSPKLNLAASTILGEFTFGSTNFAGAVKTGDIAWDASGNNVTGQGVAIYRKGIVGADGTKVTFVIDTSGNATFAGTLSAPNGTIGGFTIDGKLYNQKTTLTDANDGIYLATDGIALGANNKFKVLSNGALTATSATITGAITATSGFIGTVADGFSINSSYIAKGKISLTDSNAGVYIGADGIALGASSVFKVTNTGVLTATSANITGAITATSGSFTGSITAGSGSVGGFTIGATSLTAGTGSVAIGMATSGGYAFFAGNATPASAPFHVTDAGYVKSTNGNIGGFGVSANSLTFGSGGNTVGIDSGGTNPAFYAGSATPGSAPFRVSTSGVLVATSATITGAITATSGSFTGSITAGSGSVGGWTIAAGKISSGNIDIDSANARIQAGPSASNYVRISADGIVGVDSVLGQTFNLPTNGGRPTFSSGEITLTKFVVSTQGVIQTSDTVGDGSGSGQGIRINNTGIKGFKSGNANPTFHLDATNGDVTFGLTSGNYLQYTSSNGVLGFKAGTGGVVTNIDNDGVTVGTSGSKRVFLGTFTTGIYTNPASLYFRNSSNTLMMGMYLNGENAPTLDMQVGTAYIYNGIYNVGKNWQHSFYSYTDNGDSYLTMDNAFGGARVQITSTSGAIAPRFSVQNTSNGTYSKLEGNSLFLQGNALSGGTLSNDTGTRLATSADLLVGQDLTVTATAYVGTRISKRYNSGNSWTVPLSDGDNDIEFKWDGGLYARIDGSSVVAVGAAGAQGATGAQGTTGAQGAQGTTGAQGADGVVGANPTFTTVTIAGFGSVISEAYGFNFQSDDGDHPAQFETAIYVGGVGLSAPGLTSGNGYFTGTTVTGYSDARLKTNILNIPNSLLKVCSLNGITYKPDIKKQTALGLKPIDKTEVGLLAHEVKEVLPEAVSTAPFDMSKNGSKSGENYLTIQYEKLVPLLVEAIKDLKAEIEELKKKIN